MTAELRRHTTAHWLAKFDEAGVPAGPVHDVAQAMEHPQSRAAGMVIDVAHPKGGVTRGLGSPVQVGGRAFANTGPAPRLGQHSASVLREFGLTDDEVRSLIDDGTVFQAPAPSENSPMTSTPRVNLSDKIRATLEAEIGSGQLPAGSRLDEQALMERFEVSRTPPREALLQLTSAGLVTSVRPGTAPWWPGCTLPDYVAMLEILVELEGLAARLSARRMPAEQRGVLRDAAQACETAAQAEDAGRLRRGQPPLPRGAVRRQPQRGAGEAAAFDARAHGPPAQQRLRPAGPRAPVRGRAPRRARRGAGGRRGRGPPRDDPLHLERRQRVRRHHRQHDPAGPGTRPAAARPAKP